MARIKMLEPLEWRKLDWNKRMHMAAILFIRKCSDEELFANKKLSASYFKVRKFFEKKEHKEMNLMYDFLWSMKEVKVMSMFEVWEAMIRYNQEQRFIRVQPPNPTKQEDITLADIMDL